MSSEIEVPETPNWLKALEEKRQKRVQARLGHEAGAGALCIKCGDKCPGLDLHFWRKACKICRCAKEDHDVPDDDIYGWAQFQLLGSKPNKIKTKITLPGKKDEVELEWAPKGQKDTIDKYLKTLPPEALPVKGSQAAQERKQLLQKQIPVHDIDPSLCHELNEEEVKAMEEYIAHVKNSSVGVGQIVNLSNVIRANLHNISPQEAHIIASKYSKGVPFSEIVKHQSSLAQSLENLTLKNLKNRKYKQALPVMQPAKLPEKVADDIAQNATPVKVKDIVNPLYSNPSTLRETSQPQYSHNFKPRQWENRGPGKNCDYEIDNRLLQGTNFDPSKTPSQFLGNYSTGFKPIHQHPTTYEKEFLTQPLTDIAYGAAMDKGEPLVPSGMRPDGQTNEDIHQYGFENPYFNNPNARLGPKSLPTYAAAGRDPTMLNRDAKAPKSVKDLMYSTYDPTKGPIPQDDDRSRTNRRDVESILPPMPTLNTYKHDPSVISPFQNDKTIANSTDTNSMVPQYSSGHPVSNRYRHGSSGTGPVPHAVGNVERLPKYDPVTGQLIEQDFRQPNYQNYPYGNRVFDQDVSENKAFNDPSKNATPSKVNVQDRINRVESQVSSPSARPKKPLALLQPGHINVPEDYLEPQMVNVGAIQDINPEIRAAIAGENPAYNDDSDESQDEGGDYSPDSIREILNNIKLPECHHCKKPFDENEFAVTIERSNVLYHARCFKCAGCNQSLADNIYFYDKDSNNVYCGRDYAKIKGYPRCSACDELIFTKNYCLAENLTFHLKHFCCFLCDTPLAGQDYTSEDDKPYCLPCYETSKAAKCSTCETVIKPDERGCQLNGVHFHAEDRCYKCIVCNVPLMGKKLLLRNEKLYCSHDCFNTGRK